MRKFYCGECVNLKWEDTDGNGICFMQDVEHSAVNCGDEACEKFDRGFEHRHYIATLIQANRYRRDNHVPSIYRMPDPKELGEAIDYAIEILKENWK